MFACAFACSCSNDDTGLASGDEPKVFTGDEAYINVRLLDAGSSMRATGANPEYEYGSANEHAVKNAFFYFFDANGLMVSEGSAWNGGSANGATPVENIEFKSNSVVVLKGLTKKNYPKYMVTVLNRPTGFSVPQGTTLEELRQKLAEENAVGITVKDGTTDYFVMSTTSWAGQMDASNAAMPYYVTEVKESNFSVEPVTESNSNNYVPVYVERLAAKVTLDVDDNQLNPVTINGQKYYKIKASVAGEGNDDDVASAGTQTAAEDLYVRLDGWKLNATAKKSYMLKNINESWDNTAAGSLGFVWNKPSDFRSFWGMSFNYGQSGYPANAAGAAASQWLDYFNLNNPLALGANSYCAENTNTSAIVTANYPSAVTCALLKATVCDANGNPLDLVRFNGLLFKQSTFTQYVINVVKGKYGWNVWKKTSAEGVTPATYVQAGADDVELVNVGDGVVKVVLKAGTQLYAKGGTDAEPSFTEISDYTALNGNLATESAGAIGYTGGLMYYNIPIEHLNPNAVANNVIPEAKYGVVRNHHYVLTVNKLEKMGKGIFDPDEVIVPGDDFDDDTYYVGAKINILSWKIVNQGVEL